MNRTFWSIFALLCGFSVLACGPASVLAQVSGQNIDSKTAEIGGVNLHYMTADHGPTVILLHGYAETSRMWKPIIPLLAQKFTVIAPDLPGIGDSSIPSDVEFSMTAKTHDRFTSITLKAYRGSDKPEFSGKQESEKDCRNPH
jgi:alpha/beta hydrolase fold